MEYGGTGVVTRQGQITLPKKAREALNLALGSFLEFFYTNDLVVIKRRETPGEIFEKTSENIRKRFEAKNITGQDVSKEIQAYRTAKRQ